MHLPQIVQYSLLVHLEVFIVLSIYFPPDEHIYGLRYLQQRNGETINIATITQINKQTPKSTAEQTDVLKKSMYRVVWSRIHMSEETTPKIISKLSLRLHPKKSIFIEHAQKINDTASGDYSQCTKKGLIVEHHKCIYSQCVVNTCSQPAVIQSYFRYLLLIVTHRANADTFSKFIICTYVLIAFLQSLIS